MTDTATPETATPETATPETATRLIDRYFAMWRATDPAARQQLIAEVFTPDGRHVDPLVDARGPAALDEMVANVHAHYPGATLERTSGIDQHGDQLRFTWTLTAVDGSLVVAGTDVAELADDGRLSRVTGFWGDLPPR